jgi:hypothetical protein
VGAVVVVAAVRDSAWPSSAHSTTLSNRSFTLSPVFAEH